MASLLQGHAEEPVRQIKVPVQASRILRPYILTFPPYKTVPGEDLVLQLWVSKVQWHGELATNHVVFGASAPRQDIAAPLVNRGSVEPRPLSYEVLWRGEGWRAALEGSQPDLARLVGAIAVALIAVASYFRIPSRTMRRVRIAFLAITRLIGRDAAAGDDRPTIIIVRRRGAVQTPQLLCLSVADTRVRDSSLSGKQRAPTFSCRGDSDYDSYHGSRHGRLRDVPPFLQDRSRCGSTHRVARNRVLFHTVTSTLLWRSAPTTDSYSGWSCQPCWPSGR